MTVILLLIAFGLGIAVLYKSVSGAIPTTQANIQKIAQAIAYAEGFYVSGSRAARNHNPGDMTQDLIGRKIGTDGPFVVYSNDEDGWSNLHKQISMWLDGSSGNASPDSTISDLSEFYTTNDQTAWAANVANRLGVGLDTAIGEVS